MRRSLPKWIGIARSAFACAVVAIIGTSTPSRAQAIAGVVLRADGTTPVAGAIVETMDSSGQAIRGLSRANGTFRVRLLRAGNYTLRVLRIGYLPTTLSAVYVDAGMTVQVPAIATSAAVSLATISISSRTDCRTMANDGLAVATVWEEARKALTAAQILPLESGLFGEWIEYERVLDSTGIIVRSQSVSVVRHATTHVFRSLPGDELARSGYVKDDSTGIQFFAPDADAMLAESFSRRHCFGLHRLENDSDIIGVDFRPTRSTPGTHDIEGTVWIDRNSAELRSVDFLYTNLPDLPGAPSGGGRVEFARLLDGEWVVTKWSARLPVYRARSRPSGVRQTSTSDESRVAVRSVHEVGGEVSRLVIGDSVVLQRVGASARVQLVSSDPTLSATGVMVSLREANIATISDSNGFVKLEPLPAGQYVASVSVPWLDSLGTPPLEKLIVARTGLSIDSIQLPSVANWLSRSCSADRSAAGTAFLQGTVRHSTGTPAAGVDVRVAFARVDARFLKTKSVVLRDATTSTKSNAMGRWRICGLPHATDLSIEARSENGAARRKLRIELAHTFQTLELRLSLDPVLTPRSTFQLSVASMDQRALSHVKLDIFGADDFHRAVETDSTGFAVAIDAPTGAVTVHVSRNGYTAGDVALVLEEGRNSAAITMSILGVPTFDTDRAKGFRRTNRRLDAFESRRQNGLASRSISRDEIVARNPGATWQLLLTVGAVRVVSNIDGVSAYSARSGLPSMRDLGAACPMQIMVDGVPLVAAVGKNVDLNQLPRPEDIYGIEVFSGVNRVPLEFGALGSNRWCGLIAFWTRDQQ